jgi:DNA-binding transcriptional MerR regulator/ribosomal protein S18 acetylase RimI-like enzyme
MRIGELAKRTGTPARLLRYYEEQGLLSPARRANGYRDYAESLVDRVRQSRGLLEAGLPTRLIKIVLPCVADSENLCTIGPDLVAELQRERDRMDARIACLSRNRDAIDAYLSKVVPRVPEPSITVATPAERDAAVATFVAAFAEDPALRWFVPDDAAYPAQAAEIGAELFDLRVGHGSVWVADGGAAVAMWDPPRTRPAEPAPQPGRFGRYQAVMHAKMPTTPHWYLGVLAVHPQRRGQRLGRAVMAAGVARAEADGLPAYLETSNPRNVEIYRSAGFEVVEHLMVDDLPVWIMSTSDAATAAGRS